MKQKIVKYIIGAVILLIVGLSIAVYSLYDKYIKEKEKLRISNAAIVQNEMYVEEMWKQKEDSIQVLTGRVINLNKSKEDLNKYWKTQVTKLEAYIDNIQVEDSAIAITEKDSLGEFIKVTFSGKRYIVNYNGFTKHYIAMNKSRYELNMDFDPINLRSDFFKDSQNIWRIRTESLTPGVKVKVDYNIDSTFFFLINEGGKVEEEEDLIPFGIRGKAQVVGSWESNTWYNQHTLDVSAEMYYRFLQVTYQPLQKMVGIGVYYDLNLSKFLKVLQTIF